MEIVRNVREQILRERQSLADNKSFNSFNITRQIRKFKANYHYILKVSYTQKENNASVIVQNMKEYIKRN